jgi:hypothetical protein
LTSNLNLYWLKTKSIADTRLQAERIKYRRGLIVLRSRQRGDTRRAGSSRPMQCVLDCRDPGMLACHTSADSTTGGPKYKFTCELGQRSKKP